MPTLILYRRYFSTFITIFSLVLAGSAECSRYANEEVRICRDLYRGVCFNSTGHNLFAKQSQNLRKFIEQKIIAIKDSLSSKLKYESHLAFKKDYLRKKGIHISNNFEKNEKSFLYGLRDKPNELLEYLELPHHCQKLGHFLEASMNLESRGEAELQQKLVLFKTYRERASKSFLNMAYRNPNEFLGFTNNYCRSLEGNLPKPNFCEFDRLEKLALKFRRVDDKQFVVRSINQILKDLKGPLFGYYFRPLSSFQGLNHSQKLKRLKEIHNCRGINLFSKQVFESVNESFDKSIARSKPFIDLMLEEFYDQEQLTEINIELKAGSDMIGSFLVQSFKANDQVEAMLQRDSGVDIAWPIAPKVSSYTRDNGLGLLVLNEDLIEDENTKRLYSEFGNIRKIHSINAKYRPLKFANGQMRSEKIFFYPGLLELRKIVPESFLLVLLHELGHRLDPRNSRQNGIPLGQLYHKLLECWKERESIGLMHGQSGEAIADFFAANTLAMVALKKPQDQRQGFLKSALSVWCYKNQSASFNFESSHPHNILRVNGVFGAAPLFRKALGCDNLQIDYQTCGFSGRKTD